MTSDIHKSDNDINQKREALNSRSYSRAGVKTCQLTPFSKYYH